MDEEQYLKNRLDDQINWYDRKSAKNQTYFIVENEPIKTKEKDRRTSQKDKFRRAF